MSVGGLVCVGLILFATFCDGFCATPATGDFSLESHLGSSPAPLITGWLSAKVEFLHPSFLI